MSKKGLTVYVWKYKGRFYFCKSFGTRSAAEAYAKSLGKRKPKILKSGNKYILLTMRARPF